MDFLRGVGNWFRGVFGGNDDDEERKRREREAQQRRQQQQPQRVTVAQPKPNTQRVVVAEPQKPKQQSVEVKPTKLFQQDLKVDSPRPPTVDRNVRDNTAANMSNLEKWRRFLVPSAKDTGQKAWNIATAPFKMAEVQDKAVAQREGQQAENDAWRNIIRDRYRKGYLPQNDAVKALQEIDKADRLQQMVSDETLKAAGFNPADRRSVAEKAVGLTANIAQDVTRFPLSISMEAARGLTGNNDLRFTPKGNRFLETLFGEKDITGFRGEAERQFGSDSNLAVAGVIGLGGLDYVGGGSGRGIKAIAKNLRNVDDAVEVARVANRAGIQLTENVAEAIARSTDEVAIEDILKRVNLDQIQRQAIEEVTDDATRARIDNLERQLADELETPANKLAARKELSDIQQELLEKANQRAITQAGAGDLPIDSPAYLHRQQINDIIKKTEDDLTRYIDENPGLTRDQIEAAREAATQRALKLIEELRASRRVGLEAVEGQAKATDEALEAQAEIAENVAENRAARTAPNPGEVVEATPPASSPEVEANNPYRGRTDEDVVFEGAPTYTPREGLSIPQLFSLNRIIRENVTAPAERAVNRAVASAQTSSNPLARLFGRAPVSVTREAGATDELLKMRRLMRGEASKGKLIREKVADLTKDIPPESSARIWSTLDPEQAGKMGMEVADDLTPEELVIQGKLKEIIDYTTQGNLSRGLITPEQAANGEYIKRGYSVFEDTSDLGKAYTESRQSLLKQFKSRTDVDEKLLEEAITDPGYLVAKKSAESHAAWAMVDYGNYLARSGYVSDVARPGYIKLPSSNLLGEASGKYVPQNIAEDFTGFQYSMGVINSFNDIITTYDSLAIRRGKKQILTVFNPAVRIGNQFSNRVIFANMNGINPVQFNYVYKQAKQMKKEGHQLYREAVANGLMGTDITQADFVRRVSEWADDPNILQRAGRWAQDSYSGADDLARLTAYTVHRSRGYSVDEAVRLTQRGFQDYNQVGFAFDMAAKTPVIGNAFVRFAGDAIRIAKNAAVDQPLRTAATIAMWTQFTKMMSDKSGESEEDRQTREGRFGAPKIPFTDISLTLQTPWGEINVSRFLPFYALNDVGSEAERFMPIQGNPLKPENWNDPLLGMLGQALTDTDFRGRSIRDPDNVEFADGTSKYQEDPLSDEERRNNLWRFLFTQNMPGGRETDAVLSATGTELFGGIAGSPNEKREDVYGKERSVWQALLRAFGVKNEQFGAEQAADTRNTEAYFDRKDEIEAEVAEMSPDAQAAYRRLTGQYKTRDQKPNIFEPGETVDIKAPIYDFSEQKWAEYQQHPELFELMEKRANKEAQANGAPLNPIFDQRLPRDFRYQLAQQRSIAPGDDLELQQRLYEDPRWDVYQQMQDEYREKAAKYYPQSDNDDDFVDEMVKHQDAEFPEKPALWQQYIEARERGVKPEWSDALQAARTEWENAKLKWTNKERAVRGLPPIPAEQWFNETFGYDPDANGGFGFGGGSSYNPADHVNTLGELSNFTGGVNRLDPITAAAMPDLVRLLRGLQAQRRGGRANVKIGAGASGR